MRKKSALEIQTNCFRELEAGPESFLTLTRAAKGSRDQTVVDGK